MEAPTTCDLCGTADAESLQQHCHLATGQHLGRAHFLCPECLEAFPIPSDEELLSEGIIPADHLPEQ